MTRTMQQFVQLLCLGVHYAFKCVPLSFSAKRCVDFEEIEEGITTN